MKRVQIQVHVTCDYPGCRESGTEAQIVTGAYLFDSRAHHGRKSTPVEVDLCDKHRKELASLQKHFKQLILRNGLNKQSEDQPGDTVEEISAEDDLAEVYAR